MLLHNRQTAEAVNVNSPSIGKLWMN